MPKFTIKNTNSVRREAIYDGIRGSMKMINLEPGEEKEVEISGVVAADIKRTQENMTRKGKLGVGLVITKGDVTDEPTPMRAPQQPQPPLEPPHEPEPTTLKKK